MLNIGHTLRRGILQASSFSSGLEEIAIKRPTRNPTPEILVINYSRLTAQQRRADTLGRSAKATSRHYCVLIAMMNSVRADFPFCSAAAALAARSYFSSISAAGRPGRLAAIGKFILYLHFYGLLSAYFYWRSVPRPTPDSPPGEIKIESI